jgi:hypothetical protein
VEVASTILAWIPTNLSGIFRGYPQSLQSDAGAPPLCRYIFSQIISNLLFTSFHHKKLLLHGSFHGVS